MCKERGTFQYGSINQHRQYLGETKDEETGLNYLGSRYENGQTARFTSQDQANLDLGAQSWEDTYSRPLDVFLRDPQQLNTYSYARNNPMIISDPNGNIIPLAIAAVMAGLTAYDAYTTGQTVSDPNASLGDKAIAVALFASPAGEVKAGGKVVGKVFKSDNFSNSLVENISKQYGWGNANTLADHAKRHGSALGAKTPEQYAKIGADFRGKIGTKGIDSFTDSRGVTRAYEKSSNIFASYNKNGTTRTIYKPDPSVHGQKTNSDYWKSEKKRVE